MGINGWERDERWEYWIGINCYAVLGRENWMELIIVVDKWCSEGVWDLYGRVEGWWNIGFRVCFSVHLVLIIVELMDLRWLFLLLTISPLQGKWIWRKKQLVELSVGLMICFPIGSSYRLQSWRVYAMLIPSFPKESLFFWVDCDSANSCFKPCISTLLMVTVYIEVFGSANCDCHLDSW